MSSSEPKNCLKKSEKSWGNPQLKEKGVHGDPRRPDFFWQAVDFLIRPARLPIYPDNQFIVAFGVHRDPADCGFDSVFRDRYACSSVDGHRSVLYDAALIYGAPNSYGCGVDDVGIPGNRPILDRDD